MPLALLGHDERLERCLIRLLAITLGTTGHPATWCCHGVLPSTPSLALLEQLAPSRLVVLGSCRVTCHTLFSHIAGRLCGKGIVTSTWTEALRDHRSNGPTGAAPSVARTDSVDSAMIGPLAQVLARRWSPFCSGTKHNKENSTRK